MNRLNRVEADFLQAMSPYLKEGIDRQPILNIFRITQQQAENRGRSGYQGDMQWTDDQLK